MNGPSEEPPIPAIPGPNAGLSSEGSASADPPGGPPAPVEPLVLFGFELSLETASLDALEGAARSVTRRQVADWFSQRGGTEEVGLLSTCHRVELVVLGRDSGELERWRELLPGDPGSWRTREGRDLVHHLFRVAAGRESLALGEAEARQQVRAASRGVESRHPRPVLRDLFLGAARAAEEISPSVPASRSISSIAAERLLALLPGPRPRVLVIGSGVVGRQIAERLSGAAELTIVFHERPPEAKFLRSTGARAIGLAGMASELHGTDAIVTAAKFGTHGLRASDLPKNRPLVLVDLGVPRNIDPEVRALPNARLLDLEDLHGRPGRDRAADVEDRRVEETASRFSDRVDGLLMEPWVDAVRRAAEDVRRSELAESRPFLGRLDPDQELAIERLTQRLVTRLLLAPSERIRGLPAGPEGEVQRRLALELLDPRTADP